MANRTGINKVLTPEEIKQVQEMGRQGIPMYKIAARFNIAPNTARFHIQKTAVEAADVIAEKLASK